MITQIKRCHHTRFRMIFVTVCRCQFEIVSPIRYNRLYRRGYRHSSNPIQSTIKRDILCAFFNFYFSILTFFKLFFLNLFVVFHGRLVFWPDFVMKLDWVFLIVVAPCTNNPKIFYFHFKSFRASLLYVQAHLKILYSAAFWCQWFILKLNLRFWCCRD